MKSIRQIYDFYLTCFVHSDIDLLLVERIIKGLSVRYFPGYYLHFPDEYLDSILKDGEVIEYFLNSKIRSYNINDKSSRRVFPTVTYT